MAGRPSIYTEELADEICERISQGESLVKICQRDDMPGYTTVSRWRADNERFRLRFARAREDAADFLSYEIKDIADTQQVGEIITQRAVMVEGEPLVNDDGNALLTTEIKRADMIDHRRLRIDTRIKLMQMLKPKTYAPKPAPGSSPEDPLHVAVDREEVIGKLIGNRAATQSE